MIAQIIGGTIIAMGIVIAGSIEVYYSAFQTCVRTISEPLFSSDDPEISKIVKYSAILKCTKNLRLEGITLDINQNSN